MRWRLWRLLWGRRSSRDCCLILASSNLKRRRTKLVREAKGAAVHRLAAPRRGYTVAMPMASSTHTNTGWQRSKLVFANLQKVLGFRNFLWGPRSSRNCGLILASSNLKRRRTKLVRKAKGATIHCHAPRLHSGHAYCQQHTHKHWLTMFKASLCKLAKNVGLP